MAKQIVVTLETTSGVSEDRVVNTFAFLGGELATAGEIDDVFDRLQIFYDDVAVFLADSIPRTVAVHRMACYDVTGQLAGGPHGNPERERMFSITTAVSGGAPIPEEVAVKLRFEASGRADALVETADGVDAGTAPDRPRQRLTGGVYLGPFQTDVMSASANGRCRVAPVAMDDFVNAGVALAAPVVTAAGADMELAVWSRQNASMTTLEAVSCDDAFDTIRGRGGDPTSVNRAAA